MWELVRSNKLLRILRCQWLDDMAYAVIFIWKFVLQIQTRNDLRDQRKQLDNDNI